MNINEIKIQFEHNVQEVEIILAGLKKLPMEVAMELYAKLHGSANAQVTAQTQAAQAPATPAEPTPEEPTPESPTQ
jgi:hypothetical protein